MSNRPIQHQLESKSRIAFEAALPPSWVYRTVNPDYGIDGIVEVFSLDGTAIGDIFFVQLKATASKSSNKALTVRLRREKCGYYDALAIPLLLVLLHENSGRLYAKWFSLPPIRERYKNSASVVFRFHDDDEWTSRKADMVADELRYMRQKARLRKREERMALYYDAKTKIDLSAPASRKDTEPLLDLKTGDVVVHDAFGRGIVEQATEYYFFVEFDDDDMLRKFEPGDSRDFVKFQSTTT
jgi:hypothetical protein